MKLKTLFFVIGGVFGCISCITNKHIKRIQSPQGIVKNGVYHPFIMDNKDSNCYFCSSHYSDLSHTYRTAPIREICTCELMDSSLMNIALNYEVRGGILPSTQCVCFYDSSFVSNYILPLFENESDRKEIEYTLANASDSSFNQVIDFGNKVIINENAWYYPLKSKRFIMAMYRDSKWLKSIIPQEKWIYYSECYCEETIEYMLIPLLEMKENE